jgi:small conductance mechanosensitive channel
MSFENWIPLIEKKLTRWWTYFVQMLPNIILAIIVLTFFAIVARILRKISYNFTLRLSKSISVSSLISGITYALIIVFGITAALEILQLEKTVSSLLAGVGIIGLALGFAFQDLTANFISGAFIAFRRPFEVGHFIETNGFTGCVEEIQLRSTMLKTSTGLFVIIPNKDIFQKPIINYSRTNERRLDLVFIIPNTIDPIFMTTLAEKSLSTPAIRKFAKKIEIFFSAIETPHLKLEIYLWTENINPSQFMAARHAAIIALSKMFAENKIYQIQYPAPVTQNG